MLSAPSQPPPPLPSQCFSIAIHSYSFICIYEIYKILLSTSSSSVLHIKRVKRTHTQSQIYRNHNIDNFHVIFFNGAKRVNLSSNTYLYSHQDPQKDIIIINNSTTQKVIHKLIFDSNLVRCVRIICDCARFIHSLWRFWMIFRHVSHNLFPM